VEKVEICGKIAGGTGNYNAHYAAYPDIDWPKQARAFTESLGALSPLLLWLYISRLFRIDMESIRSTDRAAPLPGRALPRYI